MLRPGPLLLVLLQACAAALSGRSAELVVVNARIRTLDAAAPEARALAVSGNRLAAVGDEAAVRALAGAGTRVIDAGGRLILPGFNDAHVHFLSGGADLSAVQLRDARSRGEFVDRIARFAARLPKGRWILDGNWDHEKWTPAQLPARQWIDAVTPDHPVFIKRLDGHMALANSHALRLAGVTRATKDVEGGVIVRDAEGEPTGVLKDAAMAYVYRVVTPRTDEEKREFLEAATDHAAALGVTSVQDMSAGRDLGLYQELIRRGRLKTRVYAVSPLPDWKRWERTGARAPFGDPWLRVGGLKGFSDGSLGSTTAWFFRPYLDDPKSFGVASDELPGLPDAVRGADRAGLQVMVHAIGDRSNHEVLEAFARAGRENGGRDRRFRIEHAQHLNSDLVRRFAADRVIASMQPYHVIDDGRWAGKRLEPARLAGTYAFRELLDAGVTLAFGSDWAVAPLNPLHGIFAAVTRRTLDGRNPDGWVPAQKITVGEAVRAYTIGSARAEFQEAEKGTLAPGRLADFVVLSEDIFALDPVKIWDVRVLLTVVDGRVVHEDAAIGGTGGARTRPSR